MWNDLSIGNLFWTQTIKILNILKKYLRISARICVLYLLNTGEKGYGSKFT